MAHGKEEMRQTAVGNDRSDRAAVIRVVKGSGSYGEIQFQTIFMDYDIALDSCFSDSESILHVSFLLWIDFLTLICKKWPPTSLPRKVRQVSGHSWMSVTSETRVWFPLAQTVFFLISFPFKSLNPIFICNDAFPQGGFWVIYRSWDRPWMESSEPCKF